MLRRMDSIVKTIDTGLVLQLAQLHDVRHADVYFYNAVGTLLESSATAGKFYQSAAGWFIHTAIKQKLKVSSDLELVRIALRFNTLSRQMDVF